MTDEQIKKIKNPKLFDVGVKEEADAAANILASAFIQKARLEGLRPNG